MPFTKKQVEQSLKDLIDTYNGFLDPIKKTEFYEKGLDIDDIKISISLIQRLLNIQQYQFNYSETNGQLDNSSTTVMQILTGVFTVPITTIIWINVTFPMPFLKIISRTLDLKPESLKVYYNDGTLQNMITKIYDYYIKLDKPETLAYLTTDKEAQYLLDQLDNQIPSNIRNFFFTKGSKLILKDIDENIERVRNKIKTGVGEKSVRNLRQYIESGAAGKMLQEEILIGIKRIIKITVEWAAIIHTKEFTDNQDFTKFIKYLNEIKATLAQQKNKFDESILEKCPGMDEKVIQSIRNEFDLRINDVISEQFKLHIEPLKPYKKKRKDSINANIDHLEMLRDLKHAAMQIHFNDPEFKTAYLNAYLPADIIQEEEAVESLNAHIKSKFPEMIVPTAKRLILVLKDLKVYTKSIKNKIVEILGKNIKGDENWLDGYVADVSVSDDEKNTTNKNDTNNAIETKEEQLQNNNEDKNSQSTASVRSNSNSEPSSTSSSVLENNNLAQQSDNQNVIEKSPQPSSDNNTPQSQQLNVDTNELDDSTSLNNTKTLYEIEGIVNRLLTIINTKQEILAQMYAIKRINKNVNAGKNAKVINPEDQLSILKKMYSDEKNTDTVDAAQWDINQLKKKLVALKKENEEVDLIIYNRNKKLQSISVRIYNLEKDIPKLISNRAEKKSEIPIDISAHENERELAYKWARTKKITGTVFACFPVIGWGIFLYKWYQASKLKYLPEGVTAKGHAVESMGKLWTKHTRYSATLALNSMTKAQIDFEQDKVDQVNAINTVISQLTTYSSKLNTTQSDEQKALVADKEKSQKLTQQFADIQTRIEFVTKHQKTVEAMLDADKELQYMDGKFNTFDQEENDELLELNQQNPSSATTQPIKRYYSETLKLNQSNNNSNSGANSSTVSNNQAQTNNNNNRVRFNFRGLGKNSTNKQG